MKMKISAVCIGIIVGSVYFGQPAQAQSCSEALKDKNHTFTRKSLALLIEWDRTPNRSQNRKKVCRIEQQATANYRNQVNFLKGEGYCVGVSPYRDTTHLARAEKDLATSIEDMNGSCK